MSCIIFTLLFWNWHRFIISSFEIFGELHFDELFCLVHIEIYEWNVGVLNIFVVFIVIYWKSFRLVLYLAIVLSVLSSYGHQLSIQFIGSEWVDENRGWFLVNILLVLLCSSFLIKWRILWATTILNHVCFILLLNYWWRREFKFRSLLTGIRRSFCQLTPEWSLSSFPFPSPLSSEFPKSSGGMSRLLIFYAKGFESIVQGLFRSFVISRHYPFT